MDISEGLFKFILILILLITIVASGAMFYSALKKQRVAMGRQYTSGSPVSNIVTIISITIIFLGVGFISANDDNTTKKIAICVLGGIVSFGLIYLNLKNKKKKDDN